MKHQHDEPQDDDILQRFQDYFIRPNRRTYKINNYKAPSRGYNQPYYPVNGYAHKSHMYYPSTPPSTTTTTTTRTPTTSTSAHYGYPTGYYPTGYNQGSYHNFGYNTNNHNTNNHQMAHYPHVKQPLIVHVINRNVTITNMNPPNLHFLFPSHGYGGYYAPKYHPNFQRHHGNGPIMINLLNGALPTGNGFPLYQHPNQKVNVVSETQSVVKFYPKKIGNHRYPLPIYVINYHVIKSPTATTTTTMSPPTTSTTLATTTTTMAAPTTTTAPPTTTTTAASPTTTTIATTTNAGALEPAIGVIPDTGMAVSFQKVLVRNNFCVCTYLSDRWQDCARIWMGKERNFWSV